MKATTASSGPGPFASAHLGGNRLSRRPELAWLARAGLVARGVVYAVVGILALKLALGHGGKAANQQGALMTIARQPFGKALLVATAIGLGGYAAWRLIRAAIGHGTRERDSAFDRIAGLGSGVAYAALCATAVKILVGANSSSAGSNPQKATAGVLGWTAGPELVGIAGAVFVGVGLYQGYKGVSEKFLDSSDTAQMSRRVVRGFTALGVFGHLARMVVFGLVGYGLIKAAVDYNPRKAIGLDGALSKLAHNPIGPVLLGVVAAGLIGFALYSMADARYRKV